MNSTKYLEKYSDAELLKARKDAQSSITDGKLLGRTEPYLAIIKNINSVLVKRIEQKRGFGVKRENFPGHYIYFCTNDEWCTPTFCGPGTGHSIKIWRTVEGAQRFADRVHGEVIKV